MSKRMMVLGFFLITAFASLFLSYGVFAASEGEKCGTIAGISCDKGPLCDHEPGSCAVTHPVGTCVKIPDVCAMVIIEVCGCDGKTYNNDCERMNAGAQKKRDGRC